MYPHINITTLKIIYFACFHAVMEYGVIVWGNSVESRRVLLQQKRIVRVMTGSRPKTSCKPLFQRLEILTLPSQYIFSLTKFLTLNLEIYKFNSTVYDINTRHKLKLHMPSTKLTMYQRGVYYSSIKIYNKLPDVIAELVINRKSFLLQLRKYLIDKAFYSIEEYMNA